MNKLEEEISLHRLSIAILRDYIDTAEWLGGKARVADILNYHEQMRLHATKLRELIARQSAANSASLRFH